MLPWGQADLMFTDDSTSIKHQPDGDDTPIYGPVLGNCQGTQGINKLSKSNFGQK